MVVNDPRIIRMHGDDLDFDLTTGRDLVRCNSKVEGSLVTNSYRFSVLDGKTDFLGRSAFGCDDRSLTGQVDGEISGDIRLGGEINLFDNNRIRRIVSDLQFDSGKDIAHAYAQVIRPGDIGGLSIHRE